MQKEMSYKIARYTSWLALILNLALFIYLSTIDSEEAIWFFLFAGPFFIIPWVLFLIVIWISSKWENVERATIIVFLVSSCILFVFAIYLTFVNNAPMNNLERITIIISVIITAETLNILFSKN